VQTPENAQTHFELLISYQMKSSSVGGFCFVDCVCVLTMTLLCRKIVWDRKHCNKLSVSLTSLTSSYPLAANVSTHSFSLV